MNLIMGPSGDATVSASGSEHGWADVPQSSIDRITVQTALRNPPREGEMHPCFSYLPGEMGPCFRY
jgi:hypothetical protein